MTEQQLQMIRSLIDAAQNVIDNWSTNRLADAVNMLEGEIENCRGLTKGENDAK